jgi:hypothetical protein
MKYLFRTLSLFSFFIFNSYLVSGQCNNSTQNPSTSIQAPLNNSIVNLTTSIQAGQYLLLQGLGLNKTYQFSSSNTDYFTIRDVEGNLLAQGNTPLTYTVGSGPDNITIHVNRQSPSCGSQATSRTISAICTNCNPEPPKVGVNTTSPVSSLDVNGTIKVGSSNHTPVKGMIRWNDVTSDFEGYNGIKWLSLSKSNSQWGNLAPAKATESSKVVASDRAIESEFGSTVSIMGDYAIIGSGGATIGTKTNQGAAYIFKNEGGQWIQQAKLVASDGNTDDVFGHSVSLSGDYAIVGAYLADINTLEDNKGAAYIFKRVGSTWTQQAKLIAIGGTSVANFGFSVDISGTYAVVGATTAIESGLAKGATYVFNRVGTVWTQQSKLIASNGDDTDKFGSAVSIINGNEIFVGAPHFESGSTLDHGAVYVFKRTGSSWAETSILTSDILGIEDNFGISVSADADYVIIGASGENAGAGAAYIFKRDISSWIQTQKLAPADLSSSVFFGSSVDVSGDYAVIGAYGIDGSKGAAYVYKRNGMAWSLQSQLVSSDGLPSDNFGFSVGVSANHIISGAKGLENSRGAAYIFNKN